MKYFIKDSRTEVKPGELFKMCSKETTPYGECTRTTVFTLTKENIELLLKDGILVASEQTPVPMAIGFYCNKFADKLNWNPKKLCNVFADLTGTHPASVFSMLLKEIAIVMDKKYENHIKDSKYFFYISLADGLIHRMDKAPEYCDHIALFRTKGDAEQALTILTDLHKTMFPTLYEGKSKD